MKIYFPKKPDDHHFPKIMKGIGHPDKYYIFVTNGIGPVGFETRDKKFLVEKYFHNMCYDFTRYHNRVEN